MAGDVSGISNVSGAVAPVANLPAPDKARSRVSIVIMQEMGEPENFMWLYRAIEDEIKKFKGISANISDDFVLGADELVKQCVLLRDIPDASPHETACISKIKTNTKSDFAFIIGVQKGEGEFYRLSFLVVDNETGGARAQAEAMTTWSGILGAALDVVRKAFGQEEDPEPAVNLEIEPRALPAEDASAHRTDAFIASEPPPPPRRSWKIPAILGGLGLATAALSITLGQIARKKESASHDASLRDEAFAEYDSAKQYADYSNIALGVTGALLGSAAIYLLVKKPSEDEGR